MLQRNIYIISKVFLIIFICKLSDWWKLTWDELIMWFFVMSNIFNIWCIFKYFWKHRIQCLWFWHSVVVIWMYMMAVYYLKEIWITAFKNVLWGRNAKTASRGLRNLFGLSAERLGCPSVSLLYFCVWVMCLLLIV